MKKFMLWVMVAVCVMMSVEPVSAAYTSERLSRITNRKEAKTYENKWMKFEDKISSLAKDVGKLADKIAMYNKHVFETKLTKKERQYYEWDNTKPSLSGTIWNRVWKKGNTIVFGGAGKDKKFTAYFFKTSDPELIFAGGIRVGASVKVLENYFGDTLTNIGTVKGNITTISGPMQESEFWEPAISIKCINGVVTEIFYDGVGNDDNGCLSKQAVDFANKQARQMGFSGIR